MKPFWGSNGKLEYFLFWGLRWPKNFAYDTYILQTYNSSSSEHVNINWCQISGNILKTKTTKDRTLTYFGIKNDLQWASKAHILHTPETSFNKHTRLTQKQWRYFEKIVEIQVWDAVSFSSLSITPNENLLMFMSYKTLISTVYFYLTSTRKQKFTIIMDFCQVKLSQNEDIKLSKISTE